MMPRLSDVRERKRPQSGRYLNRADRSLKPTRRSDDDPKEQPLRDKHTASSRRNVSVYAVYGEAKTSPYSRPSNMTRYLHDEHRHEETVMPTEPSKNSTRQSCGVAVWPGALPLRQKGHCSGASYSIIVPVVAAAKRWESSTCAELGGTRSRKFMD